MAERQGGRQATRRTQSPEAQQERSEAEQAKLLEELRDAEGELREAQIKVGELRMLLGEAAIGPPEVVEVLVDQWGAKGEYLRGDIVERAELEAGGYDVVSAVRMKTVRVLNPVEVAGYRSAPYQSTTRQLTPEGQVDMGVQAHGAFAAGLFPSEAAARDALQPREPGPAAKAAAAARAETAEAQEGQGGV